MAAQVELPAPGVPAAITGLLNVHTALDQVDPAALTALDATELARFVAEANRIGNRARALELRAVAAADRLNAAAQTGATSTGAWLAGVTHASGPAAAGAAKLANALETDCPRTADVLGQGGLSPDHAAVIAGALRHLPRDVTPTERDQVETGLINLAGQLNPTQLRRHTLRALEHTNRPTNHVDQHHAKTLEDQERAALGQADLWMRDNPDGTTHGRFLIPTLAADILRKTLQAIVAPRRNPGRTRRVNWSHEHGLAFTQLLEHLPTDRLPTKTAATILVTITETHLRERLGAAHLDTGTDISPSQARRLGCSAGILPTILDGTSLPIDLGRSKRCFTDTQKTALATLYDGCAVTGCDRPFAWTEIHHQRWWKHGGPTNLTNAIPLCGKHHQLIHDETKYTADIRTLPTDRKTVTLIRRT